jgi:glycosyltransferase involved in cell wall biosynthesis
MAGRPTRRRPRVALVGPAPTGRGGIAGTVRAIEACLSDRYELVVVATHAEGGAARKASAAVSGLARLAVLCARREVDAVHVHASTGVSFARKAAALAIARGFGVPTILHVHSGGFDERLRSTGRRGALGRGALRRALRAADAVVALTDGWAVELERFADVRARVIPNAPDGAPPARRARADPGASATIVYLGHLYRDKGVYELAEAFATLRRTRPALRLVLAGEGGERRALSERLGGDGVELPGWIGPERKSELLATATCLALPSYREGLPLVVLEAMQAGLPIVATAVGGVPEVVRHEREALLVAPRDRVALEQALARVIDDRELGRRLGAAGLRRAEAYSREAFARRVAELYDEVLD